MNTTTDTPTPSINTESATATDATAIREIEEFYIAQVNHLVEENLDSLIPALTEEYDRVIAAHQRAA